MKTALRFLALPSLLALCCYPISIASAMDVFAEDEHQEQPADDDGGFGFGDAVNDPGWGQVADEEGSAEVPAEDTDAPPPTEPEAATPALRRVSNAVFLTWVNTFASERSVPVSSHGEGLFRILVLGQAPADAVAKALARGNHALRGLEQWTGRQGLFVPETIDDDAVNWLIVAPAQTFDAFVDWARQRGASGPEHEEDLVKITKTWGGPRCFLISTEKFLNQGMAEHWGANASTRLALSAYFMARGNTPPPPWLVEGLCAQMEILLTDSKVPRITAIAYERNEVATAGSGSWARDVADLIRSEDRHLLRAGDVMGLELIGMNAVNYKQMWSFCQFIRERCGQARGERNRLVPLLDALAEGTFSPVAVEQVLGLRDPALTRAWMAWAAGQR